MGLKLTPLVVKRLLGPLSMFGPVVGISWIHIIASPLVQTVLTEGLTCLPPAANRPTHHSLYMPFVTGFEITRLPRTIINI